MANKKKEISTEVENIKENESIEIKENSTSVIQEENETLKLQLAEMKAQMEMLMKQVAIKNTENVIVTDSKKDKNITFVNMTRGTVVLRGSQIWTIEGQFSSRVFSEKEATTILDNMDKCIRSGIVYINDADFIKEHELEDAYKNIISAKDLKVLFEKDSSYIINAYKMASEEQQKIIISMIVDKKMKNISVDGNVLVELGRLSGRDLVAIEPLEDD